MRATASANRLSSKIHATLRDIEEEWRAELGPQDFAHLKELLARVWASRLAR